MLKPRASRSQHRARCIAVMLSLGVARVYRGRRSGTDGGLGPLLHKSAGCEALASASTVSTVHRIRLPTRDSTKAEGRLAARPAAMDWWISGKTFLT